MIKSIMESPSLMWVAANNYADRALAGWYYKILASPFVFVYSAFMGGDGHILAAFYIVLLSDFFAGLAAALMSRRFQLKRLGLWVVKCATYSFCIGLAGVVNGSLARSFGVSMPFLDIALTILIASEVLSIFENLRGIGLPVPPVLLNLAAGAKSKARKKLDDLLDEAGGEEK